MLRTVNAASSTLVEEDDRDHDHGEALDSELADPVLEELLQVLDVARHAAHEDAGLLLGEEVEAQSLQVREDADPQVVHDARRRACRSRAPVRAGSTTMTTAGAR